MVQAKPQSWPELKAPKYLEIPMITTDSWLSGKHKQDGAEGLWRCHDKVYDFSEWLHKHPGGADFLKISKGTDITELFEAHHISTAAENLLPKFYVKDAKTPRNSPYTFKEDGFYRVLKRRIHNKLPSVPNSVKIKSKLITDSVMATALTLLVIGSIKKSYLIGLMTSVPLCFGIIAAHNFFHQRPNWRRFYFDVTFLSYRDWLVSHVMSHHIYTNTKMDLEITMFRPFFNWLPVEKNWVARYLSWVYSPLIYVFTFIGMGLMRFTQKGFRSDDLMNLVIPAVILVASSWDVVFTLNLYLGVLVLTSVIFSFIGLTAAHHSPEIFHEGDVPREDRDWGIQQIEAVGDKIEVKGRLIWALFTFGEHTLHHLFPSLDHAVLEYLHPVFLKTCAEFEGSYKLMPYWSLIKGQFQQLSRNTPKVFPLTSSDRNS